LKKHKKILIPKTVGGDYLVHFITRNAIFILTQMLFNLLKKHFWHHRTKINNFGMTTFFGQKCIVFQVKTML